MSTPHYNVGAIALLHILLMEELSEFLEEYSYAMFSDDYRKVQKEWLDVLAVLYLLLEAIRADHKWVLDDYEDKRNRLSHVDGYEIPTMIFLVGKAIKIVSKSYRFGPSSLPEGDCIELARYPNGIPMPAIPDLQELLESISERLFFMGLVSPKGCFELFQQKDFSSEFMKAIDLKIRKIKRYHSELFVSMSAIP